MVCASALLLSQTPVVVVVVLCLGILIAGDAGAPSGVGVNYSRGDRSIERLFAHVMRRAAAAWVVYVMCSYVCVLLSVSRLVSSGRVLERERESESVVGLGVVDPGVVRTGMYMYVYIHVCVYICVCVCACGAVYYLPERVCALVGYNSVYSTSTYKYVSCIVLCTRYVVGGVACEHC